MKHEPLIRCLQPPAPARHRLSQGIKLCCITWVWSAEANHPIHAWCNAILRRNMNILWTNMHYLRQISFAFVAGEHRRDTDGSSFRSILNSLNEKRGEKGCSQTYAGHFLNRKTGTGLGWTCSAPLQHLSQFNSQEEHLKNVRGK